MSQHAKEAMLDCIKQDLVEMMADYMDSESLKLNEMIALIKHPVDRVTSDLHERMAEAAFQVYKATIVNQNEN